MATFKVSHALGVVALCAGCASVPQVPPAPKVVEVPVQVGCDKAQLPTRPVLELSKLEQGSPAEQVVKAYAASVEQLETYSQSLEELLK